MLIDEFSDVPIETRFYAVAQSAPDAIISANGKGKIIFWNASASRIFGYAVHEVIGKPVTILMPERYRALHSKGMQRLQDTGEQRHIGTIVELHGLHKSGREFPIELSLSMWSGENDEQFFNGIIRDISERKEAEHKLRSYADELEARNQELYAYDRTIAHDLKNPLTLISTYAELIQMMYGESLPQRPQDQLERIVSASKTMVEMIDQLLILANLRDTEAVITPVAVKQVLSRVLERYQRKAASEKIKISVPETLPTVMAHPLWLEQVFMNLIGNAIKYKGKDNRAPRINISYRALDGGMVQFDIEDNGLGIPEDAKQRLFEAFHRVHHNEASGSGVGLSIVQRIIQRLNGEIGVESVLGKGSTFWFKLPAAPHIE